MFCMLSMLKIVHFSTIYKIGLAFWIGRKQHVLFHSDQLNNVKWWRKEVSTPVSPALGWLGRLTTLASTAASPHQPLASPPPEAVSGTTQVKVKEGGDGALPPLASSVQSGDWGPSHHHRRGWWRWLGATGSGGDFVLAVDDMSFVGRVFGH